MDLKTRTLPYSEVLINLLKGVVYSDDAQMWNALIAHQADVRRYFEVLGVDVIIIESEGYAFLRQKIYEDEGSLKLPRLVERRPLSYPVTLLCVLLLERLYQFDSTSGDSSRLIMDREGIREMVRIFFKEHTNEARMLESIDAHINKMVDLGFLRRLPGNDDAFEVKRILKEKIPVQQLEEIKEKLEAHAKRIS